MAVLSVIPGNPLMTPAGRNDQPAVMVPGYPPRL